MIVCNTFFKKQDTWVISYTLGPQIDYIMVRNKDRKELKMSRLLLGRRLLSNTTSHLVICDIMICAAKEVKKLIVPKGKVSRFDEDTTRVEFENEFQGLAQVSGQKTGIKDIWNFIKDNLLAYSNTAYGWTMRPSRHRITWSWNYNIDIAVRKQELWKS